MWIIIHLLCVTILAAWIYSNVKRLSDKLNIAIIALRKIASTDYDMNKLVVIAINALKDIDNIK